MTLPVSVIIPAWHEEKTIVKTLDSLKNLDYPLKECELIIAASTDDSTYLISKGKNMHEFGRYLVLGQRPGGKNAALQQGINASKGEIIVLLDADTAAEKEWLPELIKPIKLGKAACTNGNESPLNKSFFNNYFIIEKTYGRQFLRQQSTHGPGGIAFKRKLLNEIGMNHLFNKEIYAGVDHNFGEKIIEKGYSIHFAKDAKTKTPYNKTFGGFIKDSLRWKRAYFSLISKEQSAKILMLNSLIILSLIAWPFIFLFKLEFVFYLPFILYFFYLLFQCVISSIIDSKIGLLFYFPVYLILNLVDRTLTSYVFLGKSLGFDFSQKTNFKGER